MLNQQANNHLNTSKMSQDEQRQQQQSQEEQQQMEQNYDQNFQSLETSNKSPSPPSKQNNYNQTKNNNQNSNIHQKYNQKQHFQNQQNVPSYQNKEPTQTLISLSNKQVTQQSIQKQQQNEEQIKSDHIQIQRQKQKQQIQFVKQLQKSLQIKKQQTQNIKKLLIEKRKQIKQIGQQVDKDIQKNMFRIGKKKSATVNIKDIFSQTKKLKNQKSGQLHEQLKTVRHSIKQAKEQIHSLQAKFNDPINQDNIQKCEINQVKIKLSQMQIDKIKDQVKMLNQQVLRMKDIFSAEQQQQTQKSTLQNSKKLTLLINQIKQQKQKQYKLQKQDIILTEKLKFFSQKQNDYEEVRKEKKRRFQSQMKNKNAEGQIKELVKQINSIMEERNKVQNEKKNIIKTTTIEVELCQAKNLQFLNKLRDIDAFLLHYYSYKSKKISVKTNQKSKTAQKLHQTIENCSPLLPSKQQKINDKNVSNSNSRFKLNQSHQAKTYKKSQTTEVTTQPFTDKNVSLIEENKPQIAKKAKLAYQFGELKKSNNCSVLSDGLLNKVLLKSINIYVDDQYLYGIQGVYLDQNLKQIKGSKIVGKNRQQTVQKRQLFLDNKSNEQLNQITVNIAKSKQITYLKLSTSSNKVFQWESKLNSNKESQQKSEKVHKYAEIYIKGMLKKREQSQSNKIQQQHQQKLILKGIGFYTISA